MCGYDTICSKQSKEKENFINVNDRIKCECEIIDTMMMMMMSLCYV